MRSRPRSVIALLALALGAGAGCTYHPSFEQRSSYEAVDAARALDARHRGPIALKWTPSSFPDRVDEIGPSGAEGAASTSVIPTGAMASGRIRELLDTAVGVAPSAGTALTIDVEEATSEYRYAVGPITERRMNWASSTLVASFHAGDRQWEQRFVGSASTAESGLEGTVLLDRAWDEVALGVVARSVVANLPDRPMNAPGATSAPAVATTPLTERPLTLSEEVEVLRRILMRKGLITEEDWAAVLAQLYAERAAPTP